MTGVIASVLAAGLLAAAGIGVRRHLRAVDDLRDRLAYLEERLAAAPRLAVPRPQTDDARRFEEQAVKLVATLQQTTQELDHFLAGLIGGERPEGGNVDDRPAARPPW